MKLYELMEAEYIKLECENIHCILNIETEAIGIRFGSRYKGELHPIGGWNGRMCDIPCFLGGYDVLSYRYMDYFGNKCLEISI